MFKTWRFCILLSFFLLLPQRVYASALGSGLELAVSYGYDNLAKGGSYLPIHVEYQNGGEDFSGKVRFLVKEADSLVYSYSYPVAVPGGGIQRSDYYIKISSFVKKIHIQVLDSHGVEKNRYEMELNSLADASRVMVGILSDTPEKLRYFNNAEIRYGLLSLETVELTAENFPAGFAGLEQLDIIIISNYRIRDLSTDQSRALMDWVKEGGVMLLGTGKRADDTIGRYAPELLEDMYESPKEAEIDLGLGGGEEPQKLSLFCVDLNLHGGNTVISGEAFPLMSTVNKEKGMIGAAAFDLCDVSEFAAFHSQFAGGFISTILGEERIDQIIREGTGLEDGYMDMESILNAGDIQNLPSMTLFTLVIFSYILLVGPVFYLFLRDRQLEFYYRPGVFFISLLFFALMILVGSKTRFYRVFYNYFTIYNADENDVNEKTYVNVRSPVNKDFSLGVEGSYSVSPVINQSYILNTEEFSPSTTPHIEIDRQEHTQTISFHKVGAFMPNVFDFEKTVENTRKEGFVGEITLFENKLYGYVTNRYKYSVKNAAIIFYGKVALLGHLDPGETIDLEKVSVMNIPMTNYNTVANYLTGLDQMNMGDSGYMDRMNMSNFINFYLNQNVNGYTADAGIIGFSESPLNTSLFLKDTFTSSGMTLLTSVMSINTVFEDRVYRQVLLKNPTVLSGSYDLKRNAIANADALVLDYHLEDTDIDVLTFEPVDAYFSEAEDNNEINIFDGEIALLNYQKGGYEKIGQTSFTYEELKPYISENTLRVRYAATPGNDMETALPMLSFVGDMEE